MFLIDRSIDGKEHAALSRLFSATVMRELSQRGRSPLFARLFQGLPFKAQHDPLLPVSSVFDQAFSLLKKDRYRVEHSYKTAITQKVLLGRHSIRTASLVNEFYVDGCKADIAIFNGTSTAYEIKSERDKMDRLDRQLSSYKKCFSKVYVITGESHLKDVRSIAPEGVGILILNSRFQISTIREASSNIDDLDIGAMADSVKQSELFSMLNKLGVPTPDVANTEIRTKVKKILKGFPKDEIQSVMVSVLRASRKTNLSDEYISSLPYSLKVAALSMQLKKREQTNFLEGINTPTREALTWAR